jgi:hypothetical protein
MTEMLVRGPTLTFDDPVKPYGTLLDVASVADSGVGWMDPAGLAESYNCLILDSETAWPCPPTSVLAAPVQAASATATTGGTLPAGTYRAVITAVNDRGETVKSNEVSQVTTGATSTVTFNWGAVTGATAYKVYVTNGAAGSQDRYIFVSAPTTTAILTSWSSYNAGVPPTSNTAIVSVTKTFEKPVWVDGFRFAVYGGITCKGPGFDMSEAETKTKAAFLASESVGVERALMKTRFVAGASWSAPTDLTPAGGAVTPAGGLAILEGDAACKYASVPTIHAPRTVASLLAGQQGSIHREGNALVTELGSKVAAGGGYGCPNQGPTGAAPASGEMWMYASGQVAVVRSEVVSGADIDRAKNDVVVLVERAYVAAVDCYASAVRVKVT